MLGHLGDYTGHSDCTIVTIQGLTEAKVLGLVKGKVAKEWLSRLQSQGGQSHGSPIAPMALKDLVWEPPEPREAESHAKSS